jgi:hypothetical protein
MPARSRKIATRSAARLGGNLMLAPAVVMMRLPLLAVEAGQLNPWRAETIRATNEKLFALAEGAVAAQISLAQSTMQFWLQVAAGGAPSLFSSAAIEKATQAALGPSGKHVRSNYNRLRRSRKSS